MSDFPTTRPPLAIVGVGRYGFMKDAVYSGRTSAGASGTAASGRIYYAPISIPWPFPVRRWAWGNGSAVSGNVDMGIYSAGGAGAGGTLIKSMGSIAVTGAGSAVQTQDASPFFVLPAGRYYLAWQCNGTTNRMWNVTPGGNPCQIAGCLQQDTTFGLAANAPTITPTAGGFSSASFPLCGLVRW